MSNLNQEAQITTPAIEVAHTSEPWQADMTDVYTEDYVISRFCGSDWKIDVANAKRAVLAVNAVRPYSNESLEAGVVEKLIEANDAAYQCITDFLEAYKNDCAKLVIDEAVKSLRTDALRLIKIARNPQGGAK